MRVVPVAVPGSPYEIIVGEQALETLPEVLRRACPADRYVLIADSAVAALYGGRVRALVEQAGPCVPLQFPAGEWNKTRETWSALTDAMLDAGVGRDGAVVALGGGVTGDLAGFVAATYHRGLPVVQVPTSLLAMLDSSVGGKTAVDTPRGKNLVGAFHQPRAVVADVGTLATLPENHLRAGLAEAVKHGAVADRTHAEALVSQAGALLAREPGTLEPLIARSVAIKAGIVAADERERGRRAILNFGHTVGHAVETASGYGLLHGEAVAIGMVAEAALGAAVGVTAPGAHEFLRAALTALGLPTAMPDHPTAELLEYMRRDKKVRRGTVNFAFLQDVGQAASDGTGKWTFEVQESLISDVIGR